LNEVRNRNLHPCLYFSLYEWFNPLYRGPNPHLYVEQVMLPQLYDVVLNYQPDYIFADGEWEHPASFWNSSNFLSWLFNVSPVKDKVVVNDRWGNDTDGKNVGVFTSEYDSQIWWNHKWEENSGLDVFSFGYNRASQAQNYSTTYDALQLLIRTVAYGGNFLLDIGPTGDGLIPVIMEERLLEIGKWLKLYGEAIYSTTPWTVRSELTNDNDKNISVFYTSSKQFKSTIYATFLRWPKDNILRLFIPITSSTTVITLLNHQGNIEWQNAGGLNIYLPQFTIETIPSTYAWSLKITNVVDLPALIPLQNFWSENWTDYAPCTNNTCEGLLNSTQAGYKPSRYEVLLFKDKTSTNLKMLNLYFSEMNRDFAASTDISILGPGYKFVGVQLGYISSIGGIGLVPLDLYWSQSRLDYYAVGSDKSYDEAKQLYKYVTRLGYVYPGAFYKKFNK